MNEELKKQMCDLIDRDSGKKEAKKNPTVKENTEKAVLSIMQQRKAERKRFISAFSMLLSILDIDDNLSEIGMKAIINDTDNDIKPEGANDNKKTG